MSPVSKKSDKPTYWRSIAELEGRPEFEQFLEHEFAEPVSDLPPTSDERRRFMQIMGASFAFAGLTTGCRWEQDYILPQTRRPEGLIPGEPRYYTTSMDMGGYATGLLAKSYDGRPVKIEGNPNHPDSLGAANVFHQASVLELYDPDRSKGFGTYSGGKRTDSSKDEFIKAIKPLMAAHRSSQGKGFRILAESTSSRTVADMKRRLLAALPEAKWYEYEPVSADNIRLGSELAFGAAYRPNYAFDKAAIVVSLDSDFLGSERAAIRNAQSFMQGRMPEKGEMSRLYIIESAYSMTGGVADHRLPLRSEFVKAVAAALDAGISGKGSPSAEMGPAQARPAAAFLEDPKVQKFVAAIEKELLANKGKSIVIAGEQQPPEVHALVHRINAVLGNVGSTITYYPDFTADRLPHKDAIIQLGKEMASGAVDTLVIIGGNPVYNAPADVGFDAALAKVKNTIRVGLHEDETTMKSGWQVPLAHYLETWGDTRGYDGTIGIQQPLIAPLYGGPSVIELIALLLDDSTKEGLDLVKRTLAASMGDDRLWRKAVHDGVLLGSGLAPVQPVLKPLGAIALSDREKAGVAVGNGQLELTLAPCPKVHDGRYANNGWLQELPDPVLKLTWGNAALIGPATAKELGVDDQTLVKLTMNGATITIPAIIAPGQAPGSVRVVLGYGRTAVGVVGIGSRLDYGLIEDYAAEYGAGDLELVGVNAYPLKTTEFGRFGGGLNVQPTGDTMKLAMTQMTHAIKDKIGRDEVQRRVPELVREGTFEEFKEKPAFAQEKVEHKALLSLWQEPVSYDKHKWGLSIDLNKCTGCNACVVACVSENNIPVVGRSRVIQGREMQWIRIDVYFRGEPDEPELAYQPLTCHQCEHAPCEQVCPVGATMHSREGLNDMVYNRCIGTRYCSNNCPYKVRRFNYFNFHEELKLEKNQTKKMMFNPDVTVRFRGVMEKCTFCIQRIQNVKIKAKNTRRAIQDGEIVTACQQTCPTGAIVFGDLNDEKSRVRALQNGPRSYAMLEELNVRPRLKYLARVKNPNPELS
ncbi:MAG TPA: TAT-variant-translocated molybdopterin oxidoreductase [Polyangiaceae bacterium]|jgi:molybdopterin-containing oxidoreductase family iron-sulfur binding subunit|nr:TAT-variant-translocated molybdopterin oxidoreductase [Polyangiaceae bacterium]